MSAAPGPDPGPDNDVEALVEDEHPRGLGDPDPGVRLPIVEQLAETDLPSSQHNYEPTIRVPDDTPTTKDRLTVLRWLFLLVAVGGAIAMLAAIFSSDAVWDRVERLVTLVITPVIALLASGVGWFFGKHSK